MVFTVGGKEYFAIPNDMLSETKEEVWPRITDERSRRTYTHTDEHKQITDGADTHARTNTSQKGKNIYKLLQLALIDGILVHIITRYSHNIQ